MRVMRLVFEKKHFFQTMFILEKNFFSRFGFSLQFYFSKKNFKCIYFTFESCLSLIMASGSQEKVKTIKYSYHINSSCRVFYYKYTVSFKYVI